MSAQTLNLLYTATLETLYMTFVAAAIAALVGIPLGVLLYATRPNNFLAKRSIYLPLGIVINIGRSVPFMVLMLAIIPFTRFVAGSAIGNTAALVPLSISAIPFIARMVENIINEVPKGLIEAAQAMGATPMQIVGKVLLPEARAGLINTMTIVIIALIGYTAIAGAIGAGGLGKVAKSYGYDRYKPEIMFACVVILVIMVQCIQSLGDYLSKRADRR
ncbi:methionine ABC transporter permease [Suttonella indologenes]|mgnify:FL=1|uniref:D-methionine transport system permease protein metI n=1 Tax=Suttonella indologenes TaxID=13276 RepID=A0A380N031_9GAMM|nr:methionine ABC transporter permease [Suttonella indologenes]SUO97626.1 D-methionine transport system permease protein metI [Suttonella indologenes]